MKKFLMTVCAAMLATTAFAQTRPSLDTRLSTATTTPGATIRIGADLIGLTPARGQEVAFFVKMRTRRPSPRRALRLGHLIGTAPLVQNGRVYSAAMPFTIPSRISRDITVGIVSVTIDRSGPRPRLIVGDREALMIDAP